MKQEYVDAWVAALRSGEYKQGCDQLKSSCNEFCCLGVLADLAIENNWFPDLQVRWDGNRLYSEDAEHSYSGTTFLLNSYMLDALNLDTDTQIILSNMNDYGSSFSSIADYIETNLQETQ